MDDIIEYSEIPNVSIAVTESNGNRNEEPLKYINNNIHQINLFWQGITYTVKKSKKEKIPILKNLTGMINSGEFMGIVGPSGAGKTTLLKVLSGLIKRNVDGKIYVNGKKKVQKLFQKFLCYVPNNNESLPNLLLRESLMVAVNLKFKNISREKKCKLVKDAIQYWGLSECENTFVSNLSDGQKKRLTIIQEVINRPPLIFLDEPTSGLDNLSCFQCISLLKHLADNGHTVVCTIHQASAKIFEQFTKLYVLIEGECLYDGFSNELLTFLSSHNLECPLYHNPADFVIEVALGVNMDTDEYLNKRKHLIAANSEKYKYNDFENMNEKTEAADYLIHHTKKHNETSLKPNEVSCTLSLLKNNQELFYEEKPDNLKIYFYQFLILFDRALLGQIREPIIIYLSSAAHVFIGILLGLLYYNIGNDARKIQDNAAFLLFVLVFLGITSMMITILTFNLEMTVLQRELFNKWYNLKIYYLARTIADIPINILQPIIFGTVSYWMTNQINDFSRFCVVILICVLTTFVSQSIGLCFGAITNIQTSIYLGPVSIIPHVLFCGFFIRLNVIPSYMKWLSYLSIYRYGYEGILISTYGFNRTLLECDVKYCPFQDPEYFLQEMGITNNLLYVNFIVLIAMILSLRIIVYFLLLWKIKKF